MFSGSAGADAAAAGDEESCAAVDVGDASGAAGCGTIAGADAPGGTSGPASVRGGSSDATGTENVTSRKLAPRHAMIRPVTSKSAVSPTRSAVRAASIMSVSAWHGSSVISRFGAPLTRSRNRIAHTPRSARRSSVPTARIRNPPSGITGGRKRPDARISAASCIAEGPRHVPDCAAAAGSMGWEPAGRATSTGGFGGDCAAPVDWARAQTSAPSIESAAATSADNTVQRPPSSREITPTCIN